MKQDWSLEYPQTLQNDFLALYYRYGMTPTCISSILMHVILPAKIIYVKNGISFPIDKQVIARGSAKYIVYFGGNGEDCMALTELQKHVPNRDNANLVFWNYPGVGNSGLPSHSSEDLYQAGYSVVKDYIDIGISPDNITLNGWSLGGHVASEVARRLYREGYFVDLYVDRSFSSVSAVIPEVIHAHSDQDSKILLSSLLSVTALMTMIAGLPGSIINTAAVVLMNAFAMTGFCASFAIQSIGMFLQEMMSAMGFEKFGAYLAMPLMELGNLVNQTMNLIAQALYDSTWWIVGVASVAVLIPLLLASVVTGLLFSALLSLQLLWTDTPILLPMQMLVEGALMVNSCSMDSVSAIQEMVKLNDSTNIHIINTNGDDIIRPNASLCAGLGFFLDNHEEERQSLNLQMNCEWYNGHHFSSITEEKLVARTMKSI